MPKCNGCNGNFDLVYQYSDTGASLCINCRAKYEQTNETVVRRLEREVNYLHDEMDSIFGIRTGGRYAPPPSPIHINTPSMNNLNFSNSVIGAVNTGYVKDLMVKMSNVAIHDNEQAAQTVKTFIDLILKARELEKEEKEKIIQQVSYLTEQLVVAQENRNTPVIRVVLQDIANAIQTVAAAPLAFEAIKRLFV